MQFWLHLQVEGVHRRMPYSATRHGFCLCLGLHAHIYSEKEFGFRLSIEGIIRIALSSKYVC